LMIVPELGKRLSLVFTGFHVDQQGWKRQRKENGLNVRGVS
jgi:hypothetical protein